jgi:transcriptional regulator with XRE-family HTH domain
MDRTALPPYKALREALGMSQRAVERELGWNSGRLSTIERGLIPTDEERRQLLGFLNERLRVLTEGEATA